MRDYFLTRFGTFAAYAVMAMFLVYWFHGHLGYSQIFIAAAVIVYGIGGFMAPPFAKVPALGTKGLRASLTAIALVLMTCGFLLQVRG